MNSIASPKTLEVYITQNFRSPLREWLDALKDKQAKGRILERFKRLREGNLGDCKSLSHGLYELRIKVGPAYRVYLAEIEGSVILLLCGGDKSTQKQDILIARRYLQDYKDYRNGQST